MRIKTNNGGNAYNTIGSPNIDFFGLVDIYSNKDYVLDLFKKAYEEDKYMAILNLLYLRDIIDGKGVRDNSKVCFKYLNKVNPELINKLIDFVLTKNNFRADDFHFILDTMDSNNINKYINALNREIDNKNFSVIKWLPSKASKTNKKRLNRFKNMAKLMSKTNKEMRQKISSLRSELFLTEHYIGKNDKVKAIPFEKVPGNAMLKYNYIFSTKAEEEFSNYIENVKSGKIKTKVKTLTPPEIINELLYNNNLNNKDQLDIYQSMWDEFERPEKIISTLVVTDVSGSMNTIIYGLKIRPMSVSIAAALYTSELNEGNLKNKFITFSDNPEIVKLKNEKLTKKVFETLGADWRNSTNLESTLELIYQLIKFGNKIDRLLIVSDMEVNECMVWNNYDSFEDKFDNTDYNFNELYSKQLNTVVENFKQKFEKDGYKMPEIIFWNVSSNKTLITGNIKGMSLISGFSNEIFKTVLTSDIPNPYEFMKEKLDNYYEKNMDWLKDVLSDLK